MVNKIMRNERSTRSLPTALINKVEPSNKKKCMTIKHLNLPHHKNEQQQENELFQKSDQPQITNTKQQKPQQQEQQFCSDSQYSFDYITYLNKLIKLLKSDISSQSKQIKYNDQKVKQQEKEVSNKKNKLQKVKKQLCELQQKLRKQQENYNRIEQQLKTTQNLTSEQQKQSNQRLQNSLSDSEIEIEKLKIQIKQKQEEQKCSKQYYQFQKRCLKNSKYFYNKTIDTFFKLIKQLSGYLQIKSLENQDQIKKEMIKMMMNGNDIEDDEKVEDKKSYYKMYFSVK